MKRKLLTLLSVCLLLTGWQWLAVGFNQPALIPPLPVLFKTLGELLLTLSFYLSLLATVGRGIEGILLSFVAASGAAWLFARYEYLYEVCRPLLTVLRSVPVISFILLSLIFLDPERIPILIAFLTMFPLLTENLAKGLRHLHPGFMWVGHQFRIGQGNRMKQIVYPQLKPYLYSGLASAVGFGWRAIIMGEVLAQCAWGVGSEMKKAQMFIEVPVLIAWTLVAIGISYLFDRAIERMSAYKIPLTFTRAAASLKTPDTESLSPIRLSDVSYRYGIRELSYTFLPGKIYGISAPSGTGKTTLLKLIDGTLSPLKGTIEIDRQTGIACVFQEPELLPHLTAFENVLLPLTRLFPAPAARQRALSYLKEMEIEQLADRYPSQLSYGQQQRVALARALAYPSPFLLMDEPFKGLDADLGCRLMQRLRTLLPQNHSIVVFTSHHPEELAALSHEIIYLKDLGGSLRTAGV